MFDINGSEFLLLIVVAIVVIGPERMPTYAAQLGAWVRTMRGYLRTAKARVDDELGEQVGDVDWTALDPRRYDPRRIVREALLDDSPATPGGPAGGPGVRTYPSRPSPTAPPSPALPSSVLQPVAGSSGAVVAAGAPAGAVTGATAPVDAVGAPFDDEAT